ncbi:MAG: WD40/YVTN/BNR-like repeat-containing protein [Thermomicrobiales bacterium]
MPAPDTLDGLLRARCIGPTRGGRVVAVSGSYHDPATFYFGACAGGVWKTNSAGDYWECISDGFFTTASIGALAVAPSDSNVIYAGTGETTIRIDVSHGDGVYRSTDAGRTWVNTGLADTRHIGKIEVHPTDPDTAWVAALGHAFGPNPERGVFKTTDGGKTWKHVLFVSDKAGAVDITHDANPRILYTSIWEASRSFSMLISGGEESGLWQSRDGGETWTDISDRPGLPKGIKGKIGVAASPAQSGRVWALIEHAKEGGLYRSDDMGDTWTKVSDNQNLLSRAWYYTHVTADPLDADTVYVNNLDLHRSIDGGKTFTTIPTPHGDNHDLWIDPANNRRMIQGNDGGANVSFNAGETWSSIYNQMTAQFYHLGISNEEPYIVYGTQQDNTSIAVPSQTNKPAIHWTDCYVAGTGESGYIQPHPENPDIIYVGAIGSSPGGGNSLQRYDRAIDQIRLITTWPEDTRGHAASEHKYRFNWTYPIVISPHDPASIYIGGNMVFKSTDEGQTWEPVSPDLSRADPSTLQKTGGPVNLDSIGAETYATVFSLVESPRKKGLFWAGSDDGLIHISRDNAKSWKNVTPAELPDFTMISCIELSPFDDKTAYVAGTRYKLDDYEPYLYVTRDLGKTWSRIDEGLPRHDFTRVIRCDPQVPGLLYVGTETGVSLSMDDGLSWQRLNLNLPVAPVPEILVHDNDLVIGTHGRSIWILDDLTPIREIARAGAPAQSHLFPPRETMRVLPGIDWSDDVPDFVNYLGGVGGGYRSRKNDLGQIERT